MAPVPTPLPPGSMTVPPLFGWEAIVVALVVVVVVAAGFLVIGAAARSSHGRSEWQAWLDGRSAGGGPADGAAE
jgi:hypothetical protein